MSTSRRFWKISEMEFTKYLLGNFIYSGSVFLLNLILPALFKNQKLEEIAYLFQMIFFLASIFGLGLNIAFLRNSKDKSDELSTQYAISILLITFSTLILGCYPNNLISKWINVEELSSINHFVFYCSIALTNLYFLNRAVLNSRKQFGLMLSMSAWVTFLRVIVLLVLWLFNLTNLTNFLIFIFILPFLGEVIYFVGFLKTSFKRNLQVINFNFFKFITFSIEIYLSGALFIWSERLYLLELRARGSEHLAEVAFSTGFLGFISVFNMTFTSYFIGKIDFQDKFQIVQFVEKVKKYFAIFFVAVFILLGTMLFFVSRLYPEFGTMFFVILTVIFLKTGILSYLGFTNLLSKTLKLQRWDLAINFFRLVIIYGVLNFINAIDFIVELIVISAIAIIGELVLRKVILGKVKNSFIWNS